MNVAAPHDTQFYPLWVTSRSATN